jgi:hypothetical protein
MSGPVTGTLDAVQPGEQVLVMGVYDRRSRSLRADRVRILGGHRRHDDLGEQRRQDDRGGHRRHDDPLAAATPEAAATTTPPAAATPEAAATTTPTP